MGAKDGKTYGDGFSGWGEGRFHDGCVER